VPRQFVTNALFAVKQTHTWVARHDVNLEWKSAGKRAVDNEVIRQRDDSSLLLKFPIDQILDQRNPELTLMLTLAVGSALQLTANQRCTDQLPMHVA